METFLASTVAVAIAEIGDKTQVATAVFVARFTETFWVILGSTVGMLLANIPVIMAGRWLMERLPLAIVTVWATYVNS